MVTGERGLVSRVSSPIPPPLTLQKVMFYGPVVKGVNFLRVLAPLCFSVMIFSLLSPLEAATCPLSLSLSLSLVHICFLYISVFPTTFLDHPVAEAFWLVHGLKGEAIKHLEMIQCRRGSNIFTSQNVLESRLIRIRPTPHSVLLHHFCLTTPTLAIS